MEPILTVKNLRIQFGDAAPVVRGIDFTVQHGETLALVGESGSGKSLTVRSLIGLHSLSAKITAEEMKLQFFSREPIHLAAETFPHLRGATIGMIFQEAGGSLNPVRSIGAQLMESLQFHGHPKTAARNRAQELLERVHLQPAERFLRSYPHQLSGGQNQRAAIALALTGNAKILLADEPTTALDHHVQAEILDLLDELKREQGLTLLLVSHDLGLVERTADRILVMQAGKIVERGTPAEIFHRPQHPYTQALLAARPSQIVEEAVEEISSENAAPELLKITALTKTYGERRFFRRSTPVRALDGFDLTIRRGESVGLFGASGSGKSTVGKCLVKLVEPDSGTVLYDAADLTKLSERQFRPFRRRIQMVLQNPYAALNPRRRVGDLLAEVIRVHGTATTVEKLLRTVGLDPERFHHRRPQTLSGGERQRVSLARALATEPEFLICDEIVSALDVRARAEMIQLLNRLRREGGLSYLVISHDPTTLAALCDRVVPMGSRRDI